MTTEPNPPAGSGNNPSVKQETHRVLRFTPSLALALLEARGCDVSPHIGGCWRDGRDPAAYYGAEQMCPACMAWAARRSEMIGDG